MAKVYTITVFPGHSVSIKEVPCVQCGKPTTVPMKAPAAVMRREPECVECIRDRIKRRQEVQQK